MVLGLLLADAQSNSISSIFRVFPNSLPGESIEVQKVLDPENKAIHIVSKSMKINSDADLVALEDQESHALRSRYGALDDFLRLEIDAMPDNKSMAVVITLVTPPFVPLDKTRFSEVELHQKTISILSANHPKTPIETMAKKYGLKIKDKLGSEGFRCTLTKAEIKKMASDPEIRQISKDIEQHNLQANPPFTSLTTSAYNPSASMPADARGQGVNAATFESGLSPDFINCLGNLASGQLDLAPASLYPPTLSHSQQTFKCLWQTATAANWWHRRPAFLHPFMDSGDSNFIVSHSIQTLSMSTTFSDIYSGCGTDTVNSLRPYGPNSPEFVQMDEWAYLSPYPVFCNPTANYGHQYEVNWQCYNAISVGNVRHTNQNHFEQPVLVRPLCNYSDGANQARNPINRYGGPTFNAANGVYGYPSGDREMPYLVVPGISPTVGVPMNDVCVPPNSALPREAQWGGTSYSAPTANGIAASVISADPRMRSWPEKVRAAMMVTAENVSNGYWNANAAGLGGYDGMDGNGVVSGANAVAFARNHIDVSAGHTNPVRDGMHAASLYASNPSGTTQNFKALVPAKPAGCI